MKKIITLVLIILICAASGTTVYGDVNELAGEDLAVYKRLEKIGAQRNDATHDQTKRIGEIRLRLKELSPEIVVKYNKRIQQYNDEIEMIKKKIAELQGKIDKVETGNPNMNKPEVERLTGELNGLSVEERRLSKPFDEQIKQVKQIAPERNAAYKNAIGKYCLIPGKEYVEVVKTNINASIGGSIISYQWKDAKGGTIAWSHLRLRDKPSISSRSKMLDDTYLIVSHSDNSIWVWAGHYKIAFFMNNKEWHGKENIAKAVKAFIDMKGLAEIDAAGK
jgi:hypothetical protein